LLHFTNYTILSRKILKTNKAGDEFNKMCKYNITDQDLKK